MFLCLLFALCSCFVLFSEWYSGSVLVLERYSCSVLILEWCSGFVYVLMVWLFCVDFGICIGFRLV